MSREIIRQSHLIAFLPTQRRWTGLILRVNALRTDGLRGLSSELTHGGKADIELGTLRPSSHNWASSAKGLITGCTEDLDRSGGEH